MNGPNLRIPLLQRERSYTGILTGLIAVLAVMLFGASTRKFYAYTMDDAFITFRYAQNFVSGHGLFFNPDDPTRAEGITSPLYALILAPFLLLGGAIVEPSKWFGVAVTVATAAVTALTTRRLTSSLDQRDSVVIAVLCAAYFLADPFAAAHAVTGMETALSCLAYSAFLLLLVPLEPADAARRRGKAIAAGFAAVSVPMLRPEMALAVSAMLVLFAMLHRESRRETLLAGAVFVTFGAIYFAIRFAYYGLLLPLPFYVKQAVGLRGTIDVARYVRHALPLFAALLLFIASLLRSDLKPSSGSHAFVLGLMVTLLLQIAYYSTVNQIMGFGYRYFQPISVALTIVGFIGLSRFLTSLPSMRSRPALLRPAMVGFWLVSVLYLVRTDGYAKRQIADTFAVWQQGQIRVARNLRAAAANEPWTIAINDCGAIPFYSGFETIDLAGLNNRAIALDRTAQAAIEELRKRRPDLIFLQAARTDGKLQNLGWENLTDENIRQLSYDYLGGMVVAHGYAYLTYAPADRSARLGAVMRAAGLID